MAKPIVRAKPKSEKILDINPAIASEPKPVIGLTYLDNSFNLTELFKVSRGNGRKIKEFESFLVKARQYKTLSELIDSHKPHNGFKNGDEKSKKKMKEIRRIYNIETDDMFHLHCCRDGNGEFVIHGFRINNCFEIVWLDPEHKIHN